jgi:Cys-tRNA(Pro) deacylase
MGILFSRMSDAPTHPTTESEARLRDFLERHQVRATLISPGVPTPTVLDAARALGVEPAQIVKTLAFEARDGAMLLVIAPGDRRVDAGKIARLAGLERAKMSSAARVLEVTGYPAGGVPPVGHLATLPVIVDRSLLEREVLIGGGGSDRLLLSISPAEVVRVSGATTGDVCV